MSKIAKYIRERIDTEFGKLDSVKACIHDIASLEDFEAFKDALELFSCNNAVGNSYIASAIICTRYPFAALIGQASLDDSASSIFDYTQFDMLPSGWQAAFGLELFEDIRETILEYCGENGFDYYHIEQIKEKFGTLRLYDNWYYASPDGDYDDNSDCYAQASEMMDKIEYIVCLYEGISSQVCINCGSSFGARVHNGWISTYCHHCDADSLREETYDLQKQVDDLSGKRSWGNTDVKTNIIEYLRNKKGWKNNRHLLKDNSVLTRYSRDTETTVDYFDLNRKWNTHAYRLAKALDEKIESDTLVTKTIEEIAKSVKD